MAKELKIYDPYSNPPIGTPEKVDRMSKVERGGDLPLERRVRDMILAGQRLQRSRDDQFDDFTEGEPPVVPTRRPGLDVVDAHNALKNIKPTVKVASKPSNLPQKGGVTTPPATTPLPEKV